MSSTSLYTLPLLLARGTTPTPVKPPSPARRCRAAISPPKTVYLDYLIHDFLFDPKHAVHIRLTTPDNERRIAFRRYSLQLREFSTERDGWLVQGTNGQPDRVYFTDGESVPASVGKVKPIDFRGPVRSAASRDGRKPG